MKAFKTAVSIFMVLVLISMTTVCSFAADSPYQSLLKKGFSADYLDSLSDEMILRIYNAIGDNEIGEITLETVYLTENGDAIQPRGPISESTLSFNCLMAPVNDKGSDIITFVLVSVYWEWAKGKPTVRRTDSIAVNWDSDLFYLDKENSFVSQDFFKNEGDSGWTIENEYGRPAEAVQGGLGYHTRLYSANEGIAGSLLYDYRGGGTLILLTPTELMYKGDKYGTSINANYAHNRNLVSGAIGFVIDGVSVSINVPSLLADTTSATGSMKYLK